MEQKQTGIPVQIASVAADSLTDQVAQVLLRSLERRPGYQARGALDSPLSDYGLESLGASRLILELQRAFSVAVPMEWLAGSGSGRELADRIAGQIRSGRGGASDPLPARPAQPAASFPLTSLQQAYLVDKEADPRQECGQDRVGCHMYREFELESLAIDRLRRAWERVLAHHEALRLTVDEQGLQSLQPMTTDFSLVVHDCGDSHLAGYEHHVHSVRERMTRHLYQAEQRSWFAIEVSRSSFGRHTIHFSIDGMVTDGRGLQLLLEHWWQFYQNESFAPAEAPSVLAECLAVLQEEKDQSPLPSRLALLDRQAGEARTVASRDLSTRQDHGRQPEATAAHWLAHGEPVEVASG